MCFVYVEFSGLSHDSHSDGFSYPKPTTASEGLSLLDYIPQIDWKIRFSKKPESIPKQRNYGRWNEGCWNEC